MVQYDQTRNVSSPKRFPLYILPKNIIDKIKASPKLIQKNTFLVLTLNTFFHSFECSVKQKTEKIQTLDFKETRHNQAMLK